MTRQHSPHDGYWQSSSGSASTEPARRGELAGPEVLELQRAALGLDEVALLAADFG